MRLQFKWLVGIAAGALLAGSPGNASTIQLSDMSSDLTPASTLDATLDFSIIGGNTLQLVVTNDTTAPDEFNINEVFWNATADVTSLALTSATHSVNGDVFAAWNPVETDTNVDGFGTFDFGLTDGVGAVPDIIQPTRNITFVLAITGICATALDCDMSDFNVANANGKIAAAKFVNGPDDPEAPGDDDSAFGAAVPEPSTGLLLGAGLTWLAGLGRRRRNRL